MLKQSAKEDVNLLKNSLFVKLSILALVVCFFSTGRSFADNNFPNNKIGIDHGFFDLTYKLDGWKYKNLKPFIIRKNDKLNHITFNKKGDFQFEISGNFFNDPPIIKNDYRIDISGSLDLTKKIEEYQISNSNVSGEVYVNDVINGERELVKGFWEGIYNPKSNNLNGRFMTNFYLEDEGKVGNLKKSLKKDKWRGQIKGIFSIKVFSREKAKKRKRSKSHNFSPSRRPKVGF